MDFMSLMPLMGMQDDVMLMKSGLAFIIGLAVHIGRQMWMERVSLREYMAEYKGRTMLSMGSLVGAFSFLATSYPDAPLMVYLMGGYCIDSLMNKAPLSTKKVETEEKIV